MATIHSPAGRHIGRWLFVADFVVLFALFNLAYEIRFGHWIRSGFGALGSLIGLVLMTLYVMDVYRAEYPVTKSRLPLRAATGVLLAGVLSTAFIYLRGPGDYVSIFGRGVLPVSLALFSVWAAYSRYRISRKVQSWNDRVRWLCIGSNERIKQFLRDYDSSPAMDVLSYPEEEYAGIWHTKVHYVGGLSKFHRVDFSAITGVILALEGPLPDNLTTSLMRLRLKGMQIFELSEFYEQFMSKLPVFHLKDGWFVYSQGFNLLHRDSDLKFKRMLDVSVALLGLVVVLPIVMVAMVAIALDSRGGVVYTQNRIGLNGKTFRLFKLRTMTEDAESTGASWARENDPRVTLVGKFLRRTRIDELPQLWNVFRGDMSFIGPRPERPEFNKMLEEDIPYYELRYLVKPGITGWAQVMYPYGSSSDDARRKLEYDLYYVKNYSLILDLAILLKTFRIVLLAKGR